MALRVPAPETPIECTHFPVHAECHFDEEVALTFLRTLGDNMFPGARTAHRFIWATGNPPDGLTAQQWEQRGHIAVGVGHYRFDEHLEGGGRMPDECAATLVIQTLGVKLTLKLEKLVAFTLATDQGPSQHPFDVTATLKALQRQHADNPDTCTLWSEFTPNVLVAHALDRAPARSTHPLVRMRQVANEFGIRPQDPAFDRLNKFISRADSGTHDHPFDIGAVYRLINLYLPNRSMWWIEQALSAHVNDVRTFNDALADIQSVGAIRTVRTSTGGEVTVCSVTSGNRMISQAARSDRGPKAGIVVQRHPETGNVQIYAHKGNRTEELRVSKTIMDEIARRLRAREEDLWYYQEEAWTILNGSTTHVRPATSITMDDLIGLITEVIGCSTFSQRRTRR